MFLDEIEKVFSLYKRWIGHKVFVLSLLFTFATYFLFNTFSLAGLDQQKSWQVILLYIALFSTSRRVIKKVTKSPSQEHQDEQV